MKYIETEWEIISCDALVDIMRLTLGVSGIFAVLQAWLLSRKGETQTWLISAWMKTLFAGRLDKLMTSDLLEPGD